MASADAKETKCIITSLLTSNPLRCTIKQLCNDFINTVGYQIPIRKLGFDTVEDYLRSIPDTVHVYGSGSFAEVQGVVTQKSAHINLLVCKQKKVKVPAYKRKYIKQSPAGYRHSSTSRYNDDSLSDALQEFHLNSTTNNYPESEESCQTPDLKKEEEQETEKETISRARFNENSQCNYSEPVENHSSAFTDEYVSKVPPKIQNNLRKLILQFPDGIWCTKLPTEYYKMFRHRISYEKYNYRSLIEMCADLPEIFHYIQPTSDDFILYDKNKPIPSVDQNENSPYQSPETEHVSTSNIFSEIPKFDWSIGPAIIPPDVLHLSDRVPRFFPDVEEGDYLDISVGEIYDISKFWVYMTFGDLKQLMTNLQIFFKNDRNRYVIPELLMEEGLYCTTLYDGEYHRAVIVNLLPMQPDFVRVLFIDYGTVGNVSSKDIWYLPKEFGKVPCQAVRCRLSNIYPPVEQNPWSVQSLQRFRKLVTNRALVAEVIAIDKEEKILEIYLADITDQNNIFYINDVLVSEGHALYTDQERKKCLIDPYHKPNVNYIHLYPEFCEIESGCAPTPSEMNYIVCNKIPMHYYMPQYFDIIYEEDTEDIEKQHLELIKSFSNFKAKPPPVVKVHTEFDYSFFPDSLVAEIRDLVKQNEASNKSKLTSKRDKMPIQSVVVKQEPKNDGESQKNESVKEYFCNKKRISEIKNGEIGNSFKNESKDKRDASVSTSPSLFDRSDSSHSQDEIIPLNNVLNKLNLNNSGSSGLNNVTKPYKPTNPFINGGYLNESNPFRVATNPFLNDFEETINKRDLFEIFAKPSEENLPEKIVNNLNTSTVCSCKVAKQINVDKSNTIDNSINNVSSSNCINNHLSGRHLNPFSPAFTPSEKTSETKQLSDTIRRVRTPPGFMSGNSQNTVPWSLNNTAPWSHINTVPYSYNNYISVSNNPYYQRFHSQNQFSMSLQGDGSGMAANYLNFMQQWYPNQFQFNIQYLQQALAAQNCYGASPPPSPSINNFQSISPDHFTGKK